MGSVCLEIIININPTENKIKIEMLSGFGKAYFTAAEDDVIIITKLKIDAAKLAMVIFFFIR